MYIFIYCKQEHYDFGMRAVKTVILVAGNLIRQMPDGDERQIVLRALRDVNVPKFLADDLVLFNGIIPYKVYLNHENIITCCFFNIVVCKSY